MCIRDRPHARLLRREGARPHAGRAFRIEAQPRKHTLDAPQPGNLAPEPLGPRTPDVKARLKGGWQGRLPWYLNRLRCMTPVEVAHRTLRAMQARAERSGLVKAPAMPAPDFSRAGAVWIASRPEIDPAKYVAAAERAADGQVDVFALRNAELRMPPRWNRDPKTGIEAPLAFGKTLDYRDADLVGDIKYLWEPNRHLHFVTLAQAYALSGRREYADALALQLDSWLLACPYGRGPNWSAALEPAIRLANWSVAWQLGAEACDAEFKARWLRSVSVHAHFVRHWMSAHSSANNH